ncbi:hypothetical protein VNI00_007575 [Paramarasmius palmivorus]|uniref:Uncharacterized protein n=1 Tax=Paramarasmius palmivorus TaxID=297713 RepID=A0AAW0CZM5_9AGAR
MSNAVVPQSNIDPLQLCDRLAKVYDSPNVSDRRKEMVKSAAEMIVSVLDNQANAGSGHVLDPVLLQSFYRAIQTLANDLESPNLSRFRAVAAAITPRERINAWKLKKAYSALKLPKPKVQSQNTVSRSAALTTVEHTATAMAIIGETAPILSPMKAVAMGLTKIVELAKTAEGNKEEAARLGEHAEAMKKRIVERMKSLPREISATLEKDCQTLKSALDDIEVKLGGMQPRQQSYRHLLKDMFFAKDRKDNLTQLRGQLNEAFQSFLLYELNCLSAITVAQD